MLTEKPITKMQIYLDVCKKISNSTVVAVQTIRTEKKNDKTKKSATIRLTNHEKNLAIDGFSSFFNKMERTKKILNDDFIFSPLSSVFINARLALESYTKSVFACKRCGEISGLTRLKNVHSTLKHLCDDGGYGGGERTSWLYIYATFVKNDDLKEALKLLDELI